MADTGRRSAADRAVVVLLGAVLLAGCTSSEASPQPPHPPPAAPTAAPPGQPALPEPTRLDTDRPRRSPGVIAAGGADAPYNYAPSVLADRGRYRMWWCSQLGVARPAGDDVLLAESVSLDGPFGPAAPVYSGRAGGFDAMHTCDPSVIKVRGTYYLYYTGAAGDHAHGNAIGLATSGDGRVWRRANGGRPIVSPAHQVRNSNVYGAGQPSALYLDGWFYLMFTDTTGRDAGPNGAGQFVLRSTDPAFGSRVQALTPGGFRGAPDTTARLRSVVDAFSADWMWVDSLAAFAIAHETTLGTTITFWDKDFRRHPYQTVLLAGPWREGPGLVRRADGHALASVADPCGRVAIDLVRATREGPAGPTDLARFGLDLIGIDACRDPTRAAAALDGFAVPSPRRTIDLVTSGRLVRIDRRSVAELLAIRVLDQRVRALDGLTVVARIKPGVPARAATGRGLAFVVDGRLWPIPANAVAAANSSPVIGMTARQWDDYERGLDLRPPPR